MIPRLCPDAGRGLAITALACEALTIASLEPASATPAASLVQAEGSPPAITTGPQGSVGVAAAPGRPRRAAEPADTSSGLLYRTSQADFTPLRDVPGAALTAHLGLNDHGQITGTYIDDDAVARPDGGYDTGHGFVQDRRGHTRRFDVPGASITLPYGVNNHGTIAGEYVDAGIVPGPGRAAQPGSVHGFIRDRHGTITTFEVPYRHLHNVSDINNRGQIVGYYDQPNFAGGGAFLRDRDGTITAITYPSAAYTLAHGINDRGQVVGAYLEPGAEPNPDGTIPAGTVHGFVWERGRFTSFDVPGSLYTQASGVNNRGQITGGRLGHEQPFRRPSEIPFDGDGGEVAQQPGVDIHATRLWLGVLEAGRALGEA